MSLSLHPKFEKLVKERVRSGKYESPEHLLTAAMVSLEQQERLARISSEELEVLFPDIRRKIAAGLKDAKEGKLSDGEEFFDQLERQIKSSSRRRRSA